MAELAGHEEIQANGGQAYPVIVFKFATPGDPYATYYLLAERVLSHAHYPLMIVAFNGQQRDTVPTVTILTRYADVHVQVNVEVAALTTTG